MLLALQLVLESFRFAWQALAGNLLRTLLSLLGVTIGIFSIIAVLTIVDSLEKNIRDSMSFLGDKVVYVQKWPWVFGPNFQWWKFVNRPSPSVAEFRFLERNLEYDLGVCILDGKNGVTLKSQNNSMEGVNITGASYDYNLITDVPIGSGRYFTQQETDAAREVAIIGADIAESLFPNSDPLGRTFKLKGLKFTVIGVMEKQGSSILSEDSQDINCILPYLTFSKLYTNQWSSPTLGVKGLESDEGLLQLESEIIGLMRSRRSLKPFQEDNFSINRPEMAANAVSSVFSVLGIAGWVIGSFSILVGGFGIANIMFVSVRERTNVIGIQKSLGAKNYFILFQFLFEAAFLSLLGGGAGILLVYLITFIPLGSLDIFLSLKNILLGLGVSTVIGLLSGIIPAAVAARLDPVIAIRSK